MGLLFGVSASSIAPKGACQGSWSLRLYAVRVGCERQGCKTPAFCQVSRPSLFQIKAGLLHHLPSKWLCWVWTGAQPRSSFTQTAEASVGRQDAWVERLLWCLLVPNLFATAAAQPASWIRPQNFGPADTCGADAVSQVARHEPPRAHIHSRGARLARAGGAPSLLSSAVGNLPFVSPLKPSPTRLQRWALGYHQCKGTPTRLPLSKPPPVTSGWHPVPARSVSPGGRSLGLDAPSDLTLHPLGPCSDLGYLGGGCNISRRILTWVKLLRWATQKDWKRYYSL